MPGLTITVRGLPELNERLESVGRATVDLSDPMREIGRYLSHFFSGEVFASRGRVIGEPWAPLKHSYEIDKAKDFPGRPPLVRTGEMIRSFKWESGRTSSRIWNASDHFEPHQEGTRYLPARVMMKVDQQRAVEIGRIVEAHIARALS